jgi:hypothetical protein
MDDEVDTTIVQEQTEQKPLTFVDQVNTVVGALVQQADGSWELGEGEYSDELRYAAVSEKRRRDAQSALGKSQHALNTTKAEVEALRKRLKSTAQVTLSPDEAEALEELKYADPEAWRVKMNELDIRAASEFDSELAKVTDEVTFGSELERRKYVLEQFNKENPDSQITEEVVANDVPPRISSKLEKGEVTFEEFLAEVQAYLGKTKVVKKEKVLGQPDLGKLGGGSTADSNAIATDAATSYAKAIF